MFSSAILGVLIFRNRGKQSKSKQSKANETVLNEHTSLLIAQQRDSYVSVIEGLKHQVKSLQGAVNRYKGIYPEEEEGYEERSIPKVTTKNLEEHYEIDIQKAIPLIQTFKNSIPFLKNMNESQIPALINNPLVKNYIWDYIKKNKDEMINLGVIVPKGTVQQQQPEEQKEVELRGINNDGTMKLEFNQQNAQFMA